MRKIMLDLNDDFMNVMETIGVPRKTWQYAVGYLSCWAAGSERYKEVTIYGSHEGDIFATYRNEKGEVTYALAAILTRGSKSYSFHS